MEVFSPQDAGLPRAWGSSRAVQGAGLSYLVKRLLLLYASLPQAAFFFFFSVEIFPIP